MTLKSYKTYNVYYSILFPRIGQLQHNEDTCQNKKDDIIHLFNRILQTSFLLLRKYEGQRVEIPKATYPTPIPPKKNGESGQF